MAGDPLIRAYLLDGAGAGRPLSWEEVRSATPDHGVLWAHLDRKADATITYLATDARLDPIVVEALVAEETRPRALAHGDGLLLILRGVNLNPGAEPDDMISIRMWIDAHRIITLRSPRLMATQDIRASIEAGAGPRNAGDFLVMVGARLNERMAPVLANFDDFLDSVEEQLLDSYKPDQFSSLSTIRRQAITIRRFIAPQRDALTRIMTEQIEWLTDLHRARLREVADRVTRYVEDLDALRERAAIIREEMANRLAEQLNRRMYLLSIVAAIFLPLGLITGLLGINVGGIPGADEPLAFAFVCGILLAAAALQVWLFRRIRLL